MILALDLGTNLGHATNPQRSQLITAGTKVLASDKQLRAARKVSPGLRDRDPRMVQFQVELLNALPGVDVVAWEDVEFSTSTAQTQLWASFRGVLWSVLDSSFPFVQRMPVPVGTLKKHATGHGNADKDDMKSALEAAIRTNRITLATDPETLDDNAIDAVWLNHYAQVHTQQ